MNLARSLVVFVLIGVLAATACRLHAQQSSPSPSPSVSEADEDEDEDASKQVGNVSPDGRYAFLIQRKDELSIDLVDAKTEKVLQHIDEGVFTATNYRVLWAPDSKGFALMTRAGHPNQGVSVYFLRGARFKEARIPDLVANIPKKLLAGKDHPHVATNNWQEAEKWNRDGSLLLTIDNTVDGAGHTASAVRTVRLGFDRSGKAKILSSTTKYDSRNDNEE